MIAALPASSGASDDVRSYDLVWILHSVGDAHQPLHAAARFTAFIPNGDAGGNAESVIPATGETIALHAYWDRIFGGYSSSFGAVFDADAENGIGRIAVNRIAAQISDPEAWIKESAQLAKQFAQAPPVSTGTNAVLLTRESETNARSIARSQAALAAARLANLINNALKQGYLGVWGVASSGMAAPSEPEGGKVPCLVNAIGRFAGFRSPPLATFPGLVPARTPGDSA